jgi:pimeloyl-ACP methyl ester carboxylesterase
VLIPATKRKLEFTYWLQPKKAPIVYIVPGLGSHRLADSALALAELVHEQGFSAVCISSPYNYEFMERASSVAMPAYTPVDAHDLHVALSSIDRRLETLHPDRLGARALMGYSMGAFHSLFIAAAATNQAPLIRFDRYVAINTPVRLLHGISKLDEFYQAPLVWPAAERTANIQNTFLKMAALSKSSLTPQASLPFEAVESRFLIGLTFRFALRDLIFSSQQRYDQGILKHPLHKLRRAPAIGKFLSIPTKITSRSLPLPIFGPRH